MKGSQVTEFSYPVNNLILPLCSFPPGSLLAHGGVFIVDDSDFSNSLILNSIRLKPVAFTIQAENKCQLFPHDSPMWIRKSL